MLYDLLITNVLCPLQITVNFKCVTLRNVGFHCVVSSLFFALMAKMFKIFCTAQNYNYGPFITASCSVLLCWISVIFLATCVWRVMIVVAHRFSTTAKHSCAYWTRSYAPCLNCTVHVQEAHQRPYRLTLIVLMWRIGWAHNNASK